MPRMSLHEERVSARGDEQENSFAQSSLEQLQRWCGREDSNLHGLAANGS